MSLPEVGFPLRYNPARPFVSRSVPQFPHGAGTGGDRGAPCTAAAEPLSLGSAERAHHRLRVPAAAEGHPPAPRGPRAPAQGRDPPAWGLAGMSCSAMLGDTHGCREGHAITHGCWAPPHPNPGVFPGSARGPRDREGDAEPLCPPPHAGAGCSLRAGQGPYPPAPAVCGGPCVRGSVLFAPQPWQSLGKGGPWGSHGGTKWAPALWVRCGSAGLGLWALHGRSGTCQRGDVTSVGTW